MYEGNYATIICSFSKMTARFLMWIFLATINPQYAFSKVHVITINNSGNHSIVCCTIAIAACDCNSLSTALTHVKSDTTINITSGTVLMKEVVQVEKGYLDNIVITGHHITVLCNNTGRIIWGTVAHIVIEGITWDQCGNPSDVSLPAIAFSNVFHISIISCTFQYFKVCQAVVLKVTNNDINVTVINSTFLSNKVAVAFDCSDNRAGLFIHDDENIPAKHVSLKVIGSLFYGNGNSGQPKSNALLGAVLLYYFFSPTSFNAVIKDSNFSANGFLGVYLFDHAKSSSEIFIYNVSVFNNKGGFQIESIGPYLLFNILSSEFIENYNGALGLNTNQGDFTFNETIFTRNNISISEQGAALNFITQVYSKIILDRCLFDRNVATENGKSIAYIFAQTTAATLTVNISISSSKFINNQQSPLRVSQLVLMFDNVTLFENNTAENGAGLYTEENAIVTVNNGSLVHFINNTAFLRGGAVFADLSNCFNNGIVFNDFLNYSSIVFINNSARVSGNSFYLNIPQSCDVVRDYTKNTSAAYIPYKFNYSQSENTVGPAVGATPYTINLCSAYHCNVVTKNCLIEGQKMLGQSIQFNGTVCDYFNTVSETVQFQIRCDNCSREYRVLNDKLLVNKESPSELTILSEGNHGDVVENRNITLELYAVLSDNYREFSAMLSFTLSGCRNGFLYTANGHKCSCYSDDNKKVRCQENPASVVAEIKVGYWLGIIHNQYTTTLCPLKYCDFMHRTETGSDFYALPGIIDNQCSAHRTGVVCSECNEGYTLAYVSIDCVSTQQCSPYNTIIVLVLTVLYWIVVIAGLFVLTYNFNKQEVSSGYFNVVIYFYSIVDVLLTSNLYIKDSSFYVVAVLSSFAKLTPTVLGRLCLVKGLDAIDQQFIHYSHTVCIAIILLGLVIAAKFSRRIHFYVNRCIALTVVLFLQLSYTTVTTVSLQLLRGTQYSGVDGVYIYLSPYMKYFEGRHAVYATVALLCGLVLVIGLPVLLLIHPLVMRRARPRLISVQLILDHFQAGYKEKYRCFAAYYLLCRLVIMLIAFFGNGDYSSMVYYIQTACVIIVMNHICFQPYKDKTLNNLGTIVLLIMVLIVNLNNFNFSESATVGLVLTLVLLPLFLLLTIGFKGLMVKLTRNRQVTTR